MPKPPSSKDKTSGGAAAKKGATKPAAPKRAERKVDVAFPKKNQPPNAAAFTARLPLSLGKKMESIRAFLLKQGKVTEDIYYFGPKSGWALRYRIGSRLLCSLHLHDGKPLGIVSLDAGGVATVDWKALSPVGQKARKAAHGSPARLWLDVLLDGEGANDFKSLLRAKLAAFAPPN